MQLIRPSKGFFFTMAVIFIVGAVQACLGGYWALQAHKTEAAVFGFIMGFVALWIAIKLARRAQAIVKKNENSANP